MPNTQLFHRQFMVGGEFVLNPLLVLSKKKGQFSEYGESFPNFHRYYTFGAYYSLKAILSNLRLCATESVLLPSYLCPSILQSFRETGTRYTFYKLKEGLLPDLEDIELKLNGAVKAILFIDYFGISYSQYLKPVLEVLRAKGVLIIQDCVQAWFRDTTQIYGEICFNSIRKYSPIEASIILSKEPLQIRYRRSFNRMFIIRKRIAQLIRYLHIEYGIFKPKSFLSGIEYFNDRYYHKGILPLTVSNRFLLDRIDFTSWAARRKENYTRLQAIGVKPTVSITPSIMDVPLGFSIQTTGRDKKKTELHKNNIHCPVHWVLSSEISKSEFECSWEISRNEITLPVFVEPDDMSHYIDKLGEIL